MLDPQAQVHCEGDLRTDTEGVAEDKGQRALSIGDRGSRVLQGSQYLRDGASTGRLRFTRKRTMRRPDSGVLCGHVRVFNGVAFASLPRYQPKHLENDMKRGFLFLTDGYRRMFTFTQMGKSTSHEPDLTLTLTLIPAVLGPLPGCSLRRIRRLSRGLRKLLV